MGKLVIATLIATALWAVFGSPFEDIVCVLASALALWAVCDNRRDERRAERRGAR